MLPVSATSPTPSTDASGLFLEELRPPLWLLDIDGSGAPSTESRSRLRCCASASKASVGLHCLVGERSLSGISPCRSHFLMCTTVPEGSCSFTQPLPTWSTLASLPLCGPLAIVTFPVLLSAAASAPPLSSSSPLAPPLLVLTAVAEATATDAFALALDLVPRPAAVEGAALPSSPPPAAMLTDADVATSRLIVSLGEAGGSLGSDFGRVCAIFSRSS
mmetsp:Transcript_26574/g.53398  ORF Transcript_26574/g.53398 Transcript_26574/m.53398 type:complete len:218 (-) Transcript_26574:880-1533(-)